MQILLVDDHALFRRGVKQLIELNLVDAVIYEAKTLLEAVVQVQTITLDLVLLDLPLPDTAGLESLFALRRARSDLPILVASMYGDEQLALRALRSGATGYLTKDRTPEELIEAVHRVLAGRRYLSPTLAEKLASALIDGDGLAPHQRLSQQEYRIMCLIASGEAPREIAKRLCLSVRTVGTYRARILTKMNRKNNVELAHYCIKNKLVD